MFFAPRNARRRVVNPAIVLPRKAGVRGVLWILLHPAPPVSLKEAAKSLRRARLRVARMRSIGLCSGRLQAAPLRRGGRGRSSAGLLGIFGLAEGEQRQDKRGTTNRSDQYAKRTNHRGFLPKANTSWATSRLLRCGSQFPL